MQWQTQRFNRLELPHPQTDGLASASLLPWHLSLWVENGSIVRLDPTGSCLKFSRKVYHESIRSQCPCSRLWRWEWPLEPIPDRLVVLTFDDSSKSHFTVVRPILKKHGFGATFFITEG